MCLVCVPGCGQGRGMFEIDDASQWWRREFPSKLNKANSSACGGPVLSTHNTSQYSTFSTVALHPFQSKGYSEWVSGVHCVVLTLFMDMIWPTNTMAFDFHINNASRLPMYQLSIFNIFFHHNTTPFPANHYSFTPPTLASQPILRRFVWYAKTVCNLNPSFTSKSHATKLYSIMPLSCHIRLKLSLRSYKTKLNACVLLFPST